MCLGVPGQVVDIVDRGAHRAVVDVAGVRREINVGLVLDDDGGLATGDWVLIHVGFAMAKIDEEEAERTLAFLKELGSVYDDEVSEIRGSGP